jgi:hypothetical protein
MSDRVSFEKIAEEIPELKTLNDKIEVVIVGYHTCPYSRKALEARLRHPRWKHSGHVLFVGYNFGDTDSLRRTTNYKGTFPLVFVKQEGDGQFKHIGGGNDFNAYVGN